MHKGLIWTGFAISFVFGAAAALTVKKFWLYHSFYFPLKFEIDLFQIITLGVTVWLAYFVTEVLEKNSETRLNIALLASGRIDRVISELSEFQKELEGSRDITNTKAAAFPKMLNAHQGIIKDFIIGDSRFDPAYLQAFENNFTTHIRSLRDLLTNTPSAPIMNGTADISSSEGRYAYSESRVELISQYLLQIETLLVRLQKEFFMRG